MLLSSQCWLYLSRYVVVDSVFRIAIQGGASVISRREGVFIMSIGSGWVLQGGRMVGTGMNVNPMATKPAVEKKYPMGYQMEVYEQYTMMKQKQRLLGVRRGTNVTFK